MAYREEVLGYYPFKDGLWRKSTSVDTQTNVTLPKISSWVKVGLPFSYDYSNGEGLDKESFALFQNWTMQNGKIVIETPALYKINKGDKVVVDGDESTVSRVLQRIMSSRNPKGGRPSKVLIIFAG